MSRSRTVDNEDYAVWIVKDYIHMKNFEYYLDLILELHEIPFEYYEESDKDREADGLYLRNYFIEDCKGRIIDDEVLESKCSVLEVLAALAVRLDHEFIGDHMVERPEDFNEDKEYKLFSEMLDNLDLLDFFGDLAEGDLDEIRDIVTDWLNRDFNRHGGGSIFPVKKSKKDQRSASIWSQAMEYIMENY